MSRSGRLASRQIRRCNRAISPVGLHSRAVAEILSALAGRKHLVRGDNDNDSICALPAWSSVHELVRLELDGLRATLCHYVLRTWPDQSRGALNLHGHSHDRLKLITRQFDVGVDARDFHPVTVPELVAPTRKSENRR